MKVKLRGIANLNSNDYDVIVIRELYDNLLIQADRRKRNWSGEKTTFVFSDYLKEIDDNNKMEEVIKYFLENNTIVSIIDKANIKNYDKPFTVISTNSGKRLLLQLENKEEYQKIRELVLQKYNFDRLKFLNKNCDINIVTVDGSDNYSSYGIKENKIKLVIADKNESEICFFKNFVAEQLSNVIEDETQFIKSNDDELFCENFRIISHSNLLTNVLYDAYMKHNCDVYENNKEKKKQLKLEGF